VLHRRQGGVDGEIETVPVETATDVGLADAGDDRAAFSPGGHALARGSNSGSHTSSWWSNVTCTGIPTWTPSGSQPTTLVIRRRSSCSSMVTIATTYGGS